VIACDALGCGESYPIDHDMLGDPGFAPGRWPGWLYLDINREDLFTREMRFCSVMCLEYWIAHETVSHRPFRSGRSEPRARDEVGWRREIRKARPGGSPPIPRRGP
jgi:hypothetical protein